MRLFWLLAATCLLCSICLAGRIDVVLSPAVADGPVTGRLVVYAVGPDKLIPPGRTPSDWDYWSNPMPLYGVDVKNLRAGESVVIDDSAARINAAPSQLAPGRWHFQAVLDHHDDASGWTMEPGNYFSEATTAMLPDQDVKIVLNQVVPQERFDLPGVKEIEIKSKLLTDFRGRPVMLRAGVVLPTNYDSSKKYPAVYEVPGFGGTHVDAMEHKIEVEEMRASEAARASSKGTDPAASPAGGSSVAVVPAAGESAVGEPAAGESVVGVPAAGVRLAEEAFWIVLDPEGPNGHTLFADSDVNGPCGRALVEELIPALEQRYSLIAQPWARLLRGHSSGGWSTCWLALEYPQVFGAAWPTSPDPLDFRKFELVNIYEDDNMFTRPDATGTRLPIPSVRDPASGKVKLHVGEESATEEVFAAGNASAQQWDSWQAAWGRRGQNGRARELYHPQTGAIDREEAEFYKRYDLRLRLHDSPTRYAPIWQNNIHLVVGDADDFYLNEAVALLAEELAQHEPSPATQPQLRPQPGAAPSPKPGGYIKIVPGRGHGEVYGSAEVRAFPQEMLNHIHAHQPAD